MATTMDVTGTPTSWRSALAAGGAIRILYPERRWFFQFGINQYF